MNILLTGGTGFVGRQVSNHCQIKMQVVREGEKHQYHPVHIIKALDKHTRWQGAFDDIDSIIHLAGLAHSHSFTDEDYQSVNVNGTLHFASEAAKAGVSRFVFVSSIGVNGTSTTSTPFSIKSQLSPHNAYAKSKLNAELGLKTISEETGMELVIVRPTLVYGTNAPGNFGSLTRLVSKTPLLPFALTKNRRDFISVKNLADLLVTCAKHPNAANHTFLASESETVSISVFTNAIAKGLGTSLIQLPVPVSLMRLAGKMLGKAEMVDQLVGNLEVDSSNLKEVLDWTPPYTMEESMAFLKQEK
ncbi:NAD-dependent epimerase/dehydratase family protein [Shewanella sp. 10N.286.52.A9]|uniref:NAD-dependent epimerase/dehydratase family protein n=1 Tax=Shewanella sp. 10N.286.52.A9 TaxID=3229711 RepID=UPI00354F38F5